jgi:hypothetical protein
MKLDTCAGRLLNGIRLLSDGSTSVYASPQPLHHRGGTLDVGEQERERLRGHGPKLLIKVDVKRTGQKADGLLNRPAPTSYVRCHPAPGRQAREKRP